MMHLFTMNTVTAPSNRLINTAMHGNAKCDNQISAANYEKKTTNSQKPLKECVNIYYFYYIHPQNWL